MGDPACWLANVCPACGAFVDDPETTPACPRCGAGLADAEVGSAPGAAVPGGPAGDPVEERPHDE